jgi:NAD dependent epimerase/dehydratase family enzyme
MRTSSRRFRWLIDRDDIEGAVNVAAPNPLPNAEFMQVLRQACGVRLGLPAKKWMLEIGAVSCVRKPNSF